jgi:excinuclease UvrABC nuclease subunit
MKKFKFFAPYKPNGKTMFPETTKKTGCYIIKENDKIVYIGMSKTNLYKTLYRHFQTWHHSQQEVITYVNKLKSNRYTVRVVYCTPLQAEKLERALIIKYKPRDNWMKYDSYQLRTTDKNLVAQYEETEVINDCPF